MIVASCRINILNIFALPLLIGFDIMDISFDQWFPPIMENLIEVSTDVQESLLTTMSWKPPRKHL